jgi:transposase
MCFTRRIGRRVSIQPRSQFSLAERLSKDGEPLEVLEGALEFERFRPLLVKGLGYSDGSKGGRPAFDPVAMFKVLVVQAQHNQSDARMEFMIRDRLSWMRFFGFALGGAMPDENTIRHYRNRLTESGTLDALMQVFEQQLGEAVYLAMGGQIVDATLVRAPKQRNTKDEKAAIKAGKSARQIWRCKLNKAHQEPKATPTGRQRC